MTEDLKALRKVAEAATPGPWEMTEESPQMHGRNFTLRVHGKAGIRMSGHCYGFSSDPEFIAAFDPTTALALIEALEQAKQAESRVRKQHEPMPYRRGARNTGVPEFVCKACHAPNWGAVEYPCPTIRVLNGEPNE